jgi:hypothetical protein
MKSKGRGSFKRRINGVGSVGKQPSSYSCLKYPLGRPGWPGSGIVKDILYGHGLNHLLPINTPDCGAHVQGPHRQTGGSSLSDLTCDGSSLWLCSNGIPLP